MRKGLRPARGRHVLEPHRSVGMRVLRRTAAVVAGVTALVLVAGVVVVYRLQGNIDTIDLADSLGNNRPANDATVDPRTNLKPMNILLMGSDTRVGLEDASGFGGTDSPDMQGERADATLLVHLAADRRSAVAVSIPRDSMVKVPACDDPDATIDGAQTMMFNAAFSIGGPACTVKTVEQNTGVSIDHFAVVNFEGFAAMVDALGGVDICVREAVSDDKSHLDLSAGDHRLDGEQALAFSRARKGFGDGSDLGRIDRQQDLLSAIVREATDTGLLLRPDRLVKFLDAATKSVTTDEGLGSVTAMSELALQIRDLRPEHVNFVTVPVEDYPSDPNRVQWSDDADALWQAIDDDAPLPGTEPPTPTTPATTPAPLQPTVSPADLTVEVVNSSGVSGLALQAAEALEVQGFTIAGRSNGAVGEVSGAVVRHPVGEEEAAVTLQLAFPGSKLEADAGLTGKLVVELGEGAPAVVELPNRVGSEPLPEQPLVATPGGGGGPEPSITARAASDETCT